MRRGLPALAVLLGFVTSPCVCSAAAHDGFVPRFAMEASGLELRAPARRGRFLDVVGRRSALFGYEGRPLEAWVYPLKLVDDLAFAFRLKDYPIEIEGEDVLARVEVRPEATVLVYSHAAFTVRAILFAPIEEPGLAILLDVESALPMTVIGRFRPRLRLMWPGGLMTPNLEWDEKTRAYVLSEESRRFVGVLGSPGARDLSVMPYQEEPKDVPIRFEIEAPVEAMRTGLVPVVLAGERERQGRGERRLRAHPGLPACALRRERRALSAPAGRDALRRDTGRRFSTVRSRGRRWASTRVSPRIRCSGRGSWPASARRETASVRASAGSSAATRCGRRSRSTPTATSPRRGSRSSS